MRKGKENRKRRRLFTILIIIGVILVLGVAVVGLVVLNNLQPKQTLVQVEKVETTPELVAKVSATGEIQPKEFVELQSEIVGIVTELYVQEGDRVSKGDPLIKIDPKQLELQIMAEKANYEISQADAANQKAQIRVQESVLLRDQASLRRVEADLNKALQSYEIAKRSFDRKQQLFEDRLLARDAYDAAKNELVTAEAALASAETAVSQARAQIAMTEVGLEQERVRYQNTQQRVSQSRANLDLRHNEYSKTLIKAPLSGVITKMNVEVGERAVPGTLDSPTATLMIIADLSVIEAEVEVDETDIVNVHVGQEATVDVDALPDRPLKGRVTEVGSSALQSQGQEAKDFKVVIQLEDPPLSLRPGLSCTADITTAIRKEVLTIPIQALTVREFALDESGSLIRQEKKSRRSKNVSANDDTPASKVKKSEIEGVFRVESGSVVFTKVETGITGETRIEVTDGLGEDDSIVVGSYKALRDLEDDDKIKISKRGR